VHALVVDNEPAVVQTARQTLNRQGFVVEVSHDLEDIEARVQVRQPDLILVSMQLPHNQGYTLLRRLRRCGVSAPILAVVGKRSLNERIRCLDQGADGYLTRPLEVVELTARARALLRRKHRERDEIFHIHDLEIDTRMHTVQRGSRTIRLTRREYALLCFLARHAGRVCSRTQIWQHLYGDRGGCKSNVVDVFIGFLRNKIDQGSSVPLILTDWGKGYMLRDCTPVYEEAGG
jgi:DNA-binding response OmpR family regulator